MDPVFIPIIAIGGFDSPQDPKIRETIEKLSRLREENIKRQGNDPFQFALYPMLMRVPKE